MDGLTIADSDVKVTRLVLYVMECPNCGWKALLMPRPMPCPNCDEPGEETGQCQAVEDA